MSYRNDALRNDDRANDGQSRAYRSLRSPVDQRRRSVILAVALAGLLALLPWTAVAELSPAIQADLYLVQTDDYMQKQDYAAAQEAMGKILELQKEHDLPLPPVFHFKYATVLDRAEAYNEAIAQLHRYLELAGQSGQHYREALTLLHKVTEAVKTPAPGTVFRDCEGCPEMVVVPAGSFMMGSPESEEGRGDDEGPVHRVTIGEPFAVGKYEVTFAEFAQFVQATGHDTGDSCWTFESEEWKERSGMSWRDPGFPQTQRAPVMCVNWDDAQKYVRWLARHTGDTYRLLSESEWEYMARGGTPTARYWGESETGQCQYANGADESTGFDWATSCDDGKAQTAPVGTYTANGYGLHDVLGNVWEWVADCWNGSYEGAPNDGSVWESGDCDRRVARGGSWSDAPWLLRSANRSRDDSGFRLNFIGFRVARTLDS